MLRFVKVYALIATLLASSSAADATKMAVSHASGEEVQDVMNLVQLKQTVSNIGSKPPPVESSPALGLSQSSSNDEDPQCPANSAAPSDELSMLQVHSSRVKGACKTLKCNKEWCGDIWDAFENEEGPTHRYNVPKGTSLGDGRSLSRVQGWDLERGNGKLREGLHACVELYLQGSNYFNRKTWQGVTCRRPSNSHSDTSKQETCLSCLCEVGISRDWAAGQLGSDDKGAGVANAAEAANAEAEAAGEAGYIPHDDSDPQRMKRLRIGQLPETERTRADYDSLKQIGELPRKKKPKRVGFSKDPLEVHEYDPASAVRPGLPGDPDDQDYYDSDLPHVGEHLGDLPDLPHVPSAGDEGYQE